MRDRLNDGEYGAADFNAAIRTFLDFAPLLVGGASAIEGITQETIDIYQGLHKAIQDEAEEKSKDRSIPASLLNHIRLFWKLENINEVVKSRVNVSDLKDGLLDDLMTDIHMGVPLDGSISKH